MLRFSFYYQLRGAAALWTVSIVFVTVGLLITFVLPAIVTEEAAADATGLLRILGGTFLALGSLTLTLMLVGLRIQRKSPHNLPVWHWWGRFWGGVIGACTFAIPASLMYPVFFVFYVNRPNGLFPADKSESHAKNLYVALIFSVIGVIGLAGIVFVARYMYRSRPRWQTQPPRTPRVDRPRLTTATLILLDRTRMKCRGGNFNRILRGAGKVEGNCLWRCCTSSH